MGGLGEDVGLVDSPRGSLQHLVYISSTLGGWLPKTPQQSGSVGRTPNDFDRSPSIIRPR